MQHFTQQERSEDFSAGRLWLLGGRKKAGKRHDVCGE
jgi:hypothetical protein